MRFFGLVLFVFSPVAVSAESKSSRVIGFRNSFNSSLDDYRSNPPRLKCSAFDRARSYANLVMKVGSDANLAKQWNSILPTTRCRLTPLIIDGSAVNTSENPEVNEFPGQGSQAVMPPTAGCFPFQKIMVINLTRQVQARCPGGGSIFIQGH